VSSLKKTLIITFLCIPTFLFLMIHSTDATSFDFAEADRLFNNRESSTEQALAAYDLYAQAARQTQGDQLNYAIGQIGRAATYLGEIARKVPADEIFPKCLADIAPGSNQPSQEYYNSLLHCGAFAVRMPGDIFKRLEIGHMLAASKGSALETLTSNLYDGGGIYRVLAAIQIHSLAKVFQAYNPRQSAELTIAAIAASENQDPFYILELNGRDYLENYLYAGMAHAVVAADAADRSLLDKALSLLDEGMRQAHSQQSSGGPALLARPVEFLAYSARIKALHQSLSECSQAADSWPRCIKTKIEQIENR
jgi:hypothetical protein